MTLISKLKNKTKLVLIISLGILFFNSCRTGCKDKKACNYNSKKILKGTCAYDPDNVKTVSMPRSAPGWSAIGLNLTTGEIINTSNTGIAVKGLLYCYIKPSAYATSILHLEGSESVSDLGSVNGLCEITNKSRPRGSPEVNSGSQHGFVVYLSSTNTYARLVVGFVLSSVEDRVTIKYEYPF